MHLTCLTLKNIFIPLDWKTALPLEVNGRLKMCCPVNSGFEIAVNSYCAVFLYNWHCEFCPCLNFFTEEIIPGDITCSVHLLLSASICVVLNEFLEI